ncbi:hypothetical protein QQ045_025021 [Rhodiola kirilowii]
MKMSNVSKILSLSLLLILTFVSFCDAGLLDKCRVKVINVLGNGTDLTIHCMDPKHDFGRQVVPFEQSWEFTAKPNILLTTLYHCTLQWDCEFKHFDIYLQIRDGVRCHSACWWHIRKDMPCSLNWKTGQWDWCFKYEDGSPADADYIVSLDRNATEF